MILKNRITAETKTWKTQSHVSQWWFIGDRTMVTTFPKLDNHFSDKYIPVSALAAIVSMGWWWWWPGMEKHVHISIGDHTLNLIETDVPGQLVWWRFSWLGDGDSAGWGREIQLVGEGDSAGWGRDVGRDYRIVDTSRILYILEVKKGHKYQDKI